MVCVIIFLPWSIDLEVKENLDFLLDIIDLFIDIDSINWKQMDLEAKIWAQPIDFIGSMPYSTVCEQWILVIGKEMARKAKVTEKDDFQR